MRRVLTVAALVCTLWVPVAAASADDTVVVPGLAFPSDETYLSYFGCESPTQDSAAPQVRIGKGSSGAPAGTRSFGFRMPATGTAAGPVHYVDSVAATTVAGLSARAAEGSTGVAYVWFAPTGLDAGQAWVGRTDLAVGPDWQEVDTATAAYTWTLYDTVAGRVVEDGGSFDIAAFTAARGDGPGYLMAGFGCDGQEFFVDALRYGSPGEVTTYDLEAIPVTATIQPSVSTVRAGEEVGLLGTTQGPDGPVGASLVLEAKPQGSDRFRPVGGPVHATAEGVVTLSVVPRKTTDYRWYLPETGYADEAWSEPVRVVVRGSRTP